MAEEPQRDVQPRLTQRERLRLQGRLAWLSIKYAWLWLKLKRLEGRFKIQEWMRGREDNPPTIKTVRQLDEESRARERGD